MEMGELRVTVRGQSVTVQPTAADMVAWERYARSQKLPMSTDAADFPRITHIAFLAYNAGLRKGAWQGSAVANFNEWLDQFEGIEAEEGDTAASPL